MSAFGSLADVLTSRVDAASVQIDDFESPAFAAIAIEEKAVPHGRASDAEIDTEMASRSTSIEIEKNGVQTVGVDLETVNVLKVREANADDAGGADETLTRRTVTRTPTSRL